METFDIKEIRKALGLTQQEFAKKLGMSLRAIQIWESGGSIPQSKFGLIEKLIKTEAKSKDAIISAPTEVVTVEASYKHLKGEKVTMVPIIHIDSVGGIWSTNQLTSSEQFVEGYAPFAAARPDDVAISQSGSSMEPTIPSGSLLHIRRVENWQEYFGYGNIYVLWLKDDRRITKEIQKYTKNPDKYVLCHSYNPSVEDEPLPRAFIREVWKVINILTPKGW